MEGVAGQKYSSTLLVMKRQACGPAGWLINESAAVVQRNPCRTYRVSGEIRARPGESLKAGSPACAGN